MSEGSTALWSATVVADQSLELDGWLRGRPDDLQPVSLLIEDLRLADSPRLAGPDHEHIQVLAESEAALPPIIVHSPSMLVVDGEHRVRAATMRGERRIEALLYHGSAADAFVLSVRMNIAHGLALSKSDRTRAAARIVASHPQWSNRMIASATGLAAGTVAEVRRRSTGHSDRSAARVGRDGRVRPVNGANGRQRVEQLLAARPDASLRAIAREAGVSPSTVCDVRQRLRAGQNVVPDQQLAPAKAVKDTQQPVTDIAEVLGLLMRDPNLRFSDAGRALLRWLHGQRTGVTQHEQIAQLVPEHCASVVARLARGYASAWDEFATRLEDREPCPSG